MKLKDLRYALDGLSDDVEVYVMADHGQQQLQANGVWYSGDTHEEMPYDGEDMTWEFKGLAEEVTAVTIVN